MRTSARVIMWRLVNVVIQPLIASAFLAVASHAQPRPIRIAPQGACEGCIVRQLVKTIHDRKMPGAFVDLPFVTATRDGRFFVHAGSRGGELYLTDTSGSIVRRIGGTGDGPGEYRAPYHVVELADYYAVFDPLVARITFLDKELRNVRTAPHRANLRLWPVWLGGNRFAFFSETLGVQPVRVNNPVHVMDATGQITRSFGDSPALPQHPGLQFSPVSRVIAPGPNGTVWVARRYQYHIEQWDTAGRLLRVYQRDLPSMRRAATDTSDIPYIGGIHAVGDGQLWVEIHTLRPSAPDPTRYRGVSHARSEVYIEAIDINSAKVLATGRLQGWVPAPGGGGMFFSTYETEGDEPLLRVWSYRIRSP